MLSRPDHSVFLNQSGEMSHCVKLVDKNWHWEDRGMDVRGREGGEKGERDVHGQEGLPAPQVQTAAS